jgi:uncharacterized protein YecT (DUF1311 family)
MRFMLVSVAVLFFFFVDGIVAFADDDAQTPGLDSCLGNAPDYNDVSNCYSNALEYWDKILNDNYKKAKNECSNAVDAQKCLATLLEAQRSWLTYRDGMKETIYEIMGRGRVTDVFTAEFMYTATKQQAVHLGELKSLW